jgi:hypothetical protein
MDSSPVNHATSQAEGSVKAGDRGSRPPLRRRAGIAVAVVVTAAAVGVTSAAALDPAPPQVNACVSKLTGAVRVVSSTTQCLGLLERPLVWAQQGTAGLPGPAGADGTDGTQGARGPEGAQGPPGGQGPAGALQPPTIVSQSFRTNLDPVLPQAGGFVSCPDGLHISGGGASVQHGSMAAVAVVSISEPFIFPGAPGGVATAWRGLAESSWSELAAHNRTVDDFEFSIRVWAICV